MADSRATVVVGPPAALRELADRLAGHDPASLIDPLRADQAARWRAGIGPRVEDYLAAFPALGERAEDLLVLIWGEVLLRAERGESPERADYQRRFPDLAQTLGIQFDLEQGLGATVPAQQAAPTLAPARGTEAEVRDLLHHQLRLVTGLCFAVTALLAVCYASFLPGDSRMLPAYAMFLVVNGGLFALLRPRRPRTLAWLRRAELVLWAAAMALSTRVQFLICDEWPPSFLGEDWIHSLIYAGAIDFTWAILVMAYGLGIPNTWRRAAGLIAVMACWPMLLLAVWGVPGGSPRERAMATLASALLLSVAAAMAVFGAHRFEALRRQVAGARKLGPYRLRRKLGEGGMGEVWLAEHELLRRPCAVKLIGPERAGDTQALRRFEREVQATATLSHPNTVEVYDYGTAGDGTFYYAMEYLPGLSLDELVRQSGPVPPARAVYLLRQVCGALQEAHGVGLVHRDIKPGNVIVCQRGGLCDVAKLLDFGLVRAPQRGGLEQTLTQEGLIAGTPTFMSPEQAAGRAEVDGRSDIYGLGALAYFLLTGRPPFIRATAVETLAAHLNEPVAPPGRHRPGLPADLEAVVLRCLEKEPAGRFGSASELDQALACCGCAGLWTPQRAADWWREHANEPSGVIHHECGNILTNPDHGGR